MQYPPLSRDGWLLFATCGVRSFAYGFLSVILGLYLDAVGLSTSAIGWIFTAALAGGAIMDDHHHCRGRQLRAQSVADCWRGSNGVGGLGFCGKSRSDPAYDRRDLRHH